MSRWVKDNIQVAGDYHPPGTYARLLSWYHNLGVEVDSLGAEFIPLATARPNPKIFVVGVLPPAIAITGRLLDRSASVQGLDPSGELGLSAPSGSWAGGSGGGSGVNQSIVDIANGMSGVDSVNDPDRYAEFLMSQGDKDLPPHQRDFKKRYYNGPEARTGYPPSSCALFAMACLRAAGLSGGVVDEAYRPGHATNNLVKIAELYGAKVEGTDPRLPEAGDIILESGAGLSQHWDVLVSNPVEGEASQVVSGGQRDQGASGSMGIGPGALIWYRHKDIHGDDRWFLNKTSSTRPIRQVEFWIDVSELPIGDGGASTGPAWQEEGSTAAAEAAAQQAKTAGTGISDSSIGAKFLEAQARAIREAQLALEKMRNTPPLKLLVNPRSFDVKGAKIVNDGNWSRKGHIIEHWGDEQDTISASGRVAGFFAVDNVNGNGGPGLTRTARNFSQAWQNFQSLYLLYRNNGAMFLSDYNSPRDRPHNNENLAYVGSIYLYYDSILYIGSFSSFNISEEESAPHTVEYSWEFNVRAAFLLDAYPGEDQFTYGAKNLLAGAGGFQGSGPLTIPASSDGIEDPPLEGIDEILAIERGDEPRTEAVDAPILDRLVRQAAANPGSTGGQTP